MGRDRRERRGGNRDFFLNRELGEKRERERERVCSGVRGGGVGGGGGQRD